MSEVAEYIMMDSSHVISNSELLSINQKGYNPNLDYDPQVRLMYLFSAQQQKPIYYRLIGGNVNDISSMKLCIEEMKVTDVVYIADKGFYSKSNVEMMKKEQLQFIIPLRRNNKLINFDPLQKADFKKELDFFIYQKRIIWYYKYESEDNHLITILDSSLQVREEADYV